MSTSLNQNSAISSSRIGYGCAELASWNQDALTRQDVYRAHQLVHTAFEGGITLFDHADIYAFGKSEALFGEVLKQSPGLRAKITIQSKCGQSLAPDWQRGKPIIVNLSADYILRAVEGTLGRLGIEQLDVLLLHAADALMQPEDIADAFDLLRQSGKVRAFGVSNFNARQMQLLQKSLRQPLIVNQIRIGLGHPGPIAEGLDFTLQLARGGAEVLAPAGAGTLDFCRLHDIQVQAWSPLRGVTPPANARVREGSTAHVLQELAHHYDQPASAVALAWLLQHPARIVPIIGTSNAEHIRQNARASAIALSREDWYRLFATAAGSGG